MNTHLASNLLYGCDASTIEVVLEPAGLNEQVCPDVPLHLLHTRDKVIVSSVDFTLSGRAGSVWREGEENS